MAELLNRAEEDDEYTMVDHPTSILPPRPAIKDRGSPLDHATFYQFMDDEGRIVNADHIKNIIFHGVSYILIYSYMN